MLTNESEQRFITRFTYSHKIYFWNLWTIEICMNIPLFSRLSFIKLSIVYRNIQCPYGNFTLNFIYEKFIYEMMYGIGTFSYMKFSHLKLSSMKWAHIRYFIWNFSIWNEQLQIKCSCMTCSYMKCSNMKWAIIYETYLQNFYILYFLNLS